MRIVKATQEGRWNKVKATTSATARFRQGISRKRVTENQGKEPQELTGSYCQPLKANLRQYKT
jgi:hypothetical protein